MKNINNIQYAYLIGIKGVAMTGLACILTDMGITVRGADVAEEFITDTVLKRKKIPVDIDFKTEYLDAFLIGKSFSQVLVVTTGAHGGLANKVCKKASEKGISVVTHAEALQIVLAEKKTISIAGTHGKTTTSAIIAYVSKTSGADFSYSVGAGSIAGLSYPSYYSKKSAYFSVEADEYFADPVLLKKPRFLFQRPDILIITSVEYDHPDVYANKEAVERAFYQLIGNTKIGSTIIICGDTHILPHIQLPYNQKLIRYGFSKQNNAVISNYSQKNHAQSFFLQINGKIEGPFTLSIYGEHNVLNATASILALHTSGISYETIKKNLKLFCGTGRRFEFVGKYKDILLYDDYAHHPTEISATLRGVHSWFPNAKIGVVFQAHMRSRTIALFKEFSQCFKDANVVGITPIFSSARELKVIDTLGKKLAHAIEAHKTVSVYGEDPKKVYQDVFNTLKSGDILITMGAGDVYKLHVTSQISKRKTKNA